LDTAAALAARRLHIQGALQEIAAAVGGAAGVASASGPVDLAPSGVDELIRMLSVLQSCGTHHPVGVDTPPTRHALRLLAMPDVARGWLQTLLRVLLKYRKLLRPGQLAAELVELSKSVRQLHGLMRDVDSTRFVVVTRAAELPRRETARLLQQLCRL